jgi:hypothetical protein
MTIFQNSSRCLASVVEMSVLCKLQTEIHTIENNFFIQTLNKWQVRITLYFIQIIDQVVCCTLSPDVLTAVQENQLLFQFCYLYLLGPFDLVGI